MALTPTSVKTSNYTAKKGQLVLCNPTGGNFVVTLPYQPSNGAQVGLQLVANADPANTVMVLANQLPGFGNGFVGDGIVTPPQVYSLNFTEVGPVTIFTYSTATQSWTVT